MKFNISYSTSGAQKCIEIDDDKKCSIFYDKKMGTEVEADKLGEQFKGYIFKITGGNDKDGFPMKQGILHKGRVRVLMYKGHSCYRPRRSGERKKKSVRGCIVGPDLRVLALKIVKKGEKPIEGLTDSQKPKTLGPKRATRLRKLFALDQKDGSDLLKKYVVRRTFTTAAGKKRQKAPKIQRLVTDVRLRRKKIYKTAKKQKWQETMKATKEYVKLAQDLKKKQLKKQQQTEQKPEEKQAEKKVEKKPEIQQKPKQEKKVKKDDKSKTKDKKQTKK